MGARRVRVVLAENMNKDLKEIGEKLEWRTGQTRMHHVFSLFFILFIF